MTVTANSGASAAKTKEKFALPALRASIRSAAAAADAAIAFARGEDIEHVMSAYNQN